MELSSLQGSSGLRLLNMTTDEIALATLQAQQLQAWITAIAIVLGPLMGVLFTLWFQARKDKRDAKEQLFLTLMGERKPLRISAEVVKALNQIDVVFNKSPAVRRLWQEYYMMLHHPPSEPRAHKWLELLSAIGQELGYKALSPLDLDKFYEPQGHVNDAEFQAKMAQQWSRVLENTEHFVVEPRKNKEPANAEVSPP